MHEYSVVRALLDQVERQVREHGARRVHRVRIRVGELAGIETDLLATAWDLARRGGPCAEATLEVVHVAARWQCPACAADLPRGGRLVCPRCGGGARLVEGEDLLLDRLELEVDDDPPPPAATAAYLEETRDV